MLIRKTCHEKVDTNNSEQYFFLTNSYCTWNGICLFPIGVSQKQKLSKSVDTCQGSSLSLLLFIFPLGEGEGERGAELRGWGRLLTSFQSESGRSALPDVNVIVASCKCISPLLKNVFLPFSTSAFLVHGFYLQMHGIQANLTLTSFGKTLFAISHTFHYSESSNVFLGINVLHCTKMHASALIWSYLQTLRRSIRTSVRHCLQSVWSFQHWSGLEPY